MNPLCSLALTLALSVTPPTSEGTGVVAVAPPPGGPSSVLIELTAQLRQFLSQRAPGVLDAAEVRARMARQSEHLSLADTERMYQSARTAEINGEPHQAIEELRATLRELERIPESPDAFAQWARAMLRLAIVESSLAGHEAQARDVLERLVRADRQLKVDPDLHGPELARQFEAVKRQMKNRREQRLVVTASPDARIFIEGKEVGSTEDGRLELLLPPGEYRVTGMREELRALPVSVNLADTDKEVELDFQTVGILRPDQGPGVAEEGAGQPQLLRVGKFLGVERLVSVSLNEQGNRSYLEAAVYDISAGRAMRSGVLKLKERAPPPGGLDAMAHFLLTGESDSKQLVANVNPLEPPRYAALFPEPVPPPKPPTTRGWIAFGTGIGAVALSGVSVAQVLSAQTSQDNAQRLLLPDGSIPFNSGPYYRHLANRNSANRRALIAGAGAGACVVATVILGYLAIKQTGELGPFRF